MIHRFRSASVSILALVATVTLAPRPAEAATFAAKDRGFALLRKQDPVSVRRFADAIRELGGLASVVLPSGGAIVYADDAALSALRRDRWITSSYRAKIREQEITTLDAGRASACRVWNTALEQNLFGFQSPQGATSESDARRVPVKLGEFGTRDALGAPMAPGTTSSLFPLGAQYYDTSEYMAGTVAVGVWLLESTGSGLDWSTGEEDQTIAGVAAGLDRWAQKGGPGAFLTFFLDVHTSVPVNGEPIQHPQSEEQIWIGQALIGAGWTEPDVFEAAFAYNNSIRTAYQTNWCYSIFIVDSDPNVNLGRFSSGGYAWAYLGGPWIYMSRFSSWAFNAASYFGAVPMHETAHIFYATDEYDGVLAHSGYLNALDNATFPDCIMNQNDSTVVCQETRNQLGWRDLNRDGVIEPLDASPSTDVSLYGRASTQDPVLHGSGTAAVTIVPSQAPFSHYWPPHSITVATIDRVEARVDEGPWITATPLDGAFDAYQEPFTYTTPSEPDGLHILEIRAHTTGGAYTEPPVRDSVWVLAQGTDRHPLVVAPKSVQAYEGQPLQFQVVAYDLDGDPIQSLAGNVQGLPAGNATFAEAPDHSGGILTWTPSFVDAATYDVSFTAVNALYNTAHTAIIVNNVDRAPSIAAPGSVSVTENQAVAFSVSAADPDGDALTDFTADTSTLPAGAAFSFDPNPTSSSGTFLWLTDFNSAGDYDVSFAASNAMTGTTQTHIHVNNLDRPPIVSVPALVTGAANRSITFQASFADPDGESAVLTATGLPSGAALNPAGSGLATFFWTPTMTQVGSSVMTLTASNALSTSTNVTIVVGAADSPPVVTVAPHAPGAEGVPMTVSASAADPDGDALLSFGTSNLPAGATFGFDLAAGTGTIAWNPDFDQAGSYTVTLSATSAQRADPVSGAVLTGAAQVVLDIANTDRAPVLLLPGDVSVTEGSPFDLDVFATDPDGDPVPSMSALLTLLPLGDASFEQTDPGSAHFHWTPGFADSRVVPYAVPIQAMNALTGSATLVIHVVNLNRPPVADAGGPYRGVVAVPVLFHGEESSDPDGEALEYRWAFGDGATATGVGPLHAYSAAGVFDVVLTVTDELLSEGQETTTAAIEAVFEARVFLSGGNRTLRLGSGKPTWCARIEPIGGAFAIGDLDLSSVRLVYGTESIAAAGGKSAPISDSDENGVNDVAICFAKADLRSLFAGLPGGRSKATVGVTGLMRNGAHVEGSLSVDVISSGSLTVAVSPNPFNPRGVLTFHTSAPGAARVRVYDANGRLVAVPLDGTVNAGYHDVMIDGRGPRGGDLGSGVYFYRVESREGNAAGRFVIAR